MKRITVVSFSPTGGTHSIAECAAKGIAEVLNIGEISTVNLNLPDIRKTEIRFGEDDIVVVATPTYAGRIPNKALPGIKNIVSDGAVGVAVVSYGNRSFDDSLSELCMVMRENGFKLAGAGAFVCRHVMSDVMGTGRPDSDDIAETESFGRSIGKKLLSGEVGELSIPGNTPPGPYYQPLDENGNPASFLKAKPKLREELCNKCGACSRVCPMGSIAADEPANVTGICIKCQACIHTCPQHARSFDDPSMLSHVRSLEKIYGGKHDANTIVF